MGPKAGFVSSTACLEDQHFKLKQFQSQRFAVKHFRIITVYLSFSRKAFMMELTAHQSSVGNVLQAGNQLIAQGNLTEEEEEEIREQMSLLNSRWENLRVASMDRQAR